jgi:hypothetical protein
MIFPLINFFPLPLHAFYHAFYSMPYPYDSTVFPTLIFRSVNTIDIVLILGAAAAAAGT